MKVWPLSLSDEGFTIVFSDEGFTIVFSDEGFTIVFNDKPSSSKTKKLNEKFIKYLE